MGRSEKVAIVTGASRGMGKQMALRLARHGVNIVMAARTMEQGESQWPGSLQQAGAEIRALGVEAIPVKCDLSIRDDVENLCFVALARYGHVDYLLKQCPVGRASGLRPLPTDRLGHLGKKHSCQPASSGNCKQVGTTRHDPKPARRHRMHHLEHCHPGRTWDARRRRWSGCSRADHQGSA